MKPTRLFLFLPLLGPACAGDGRESVSENASTTAANGPARVAGTLLDAATGAPAPDVTVTGPHGRTARSDARGRFALDGLRVGDEGEVTARAGDGRSASVHLRPLKSGTLEVVLHLAAERVRD
ncbi:MAG: carboxypeptidase regulatory-like domain-containing protein [Planctomycetes bacterium]|nr:carboxypeptidase regulatory-like domain-containing protein [Planctomycetota bacterium]